MPINSSALNGSTDPAMKAAKNKPQYPYVAHVSIYAKVMFLVNKLSAFILLNFFNFEI